MIDKLNNLPKKIILITMGDAAGSGPEIIARSIKENKVKNSLIFGDFKILSYALKKQKINPANFIRLNDFEKGKITVMGSQIKRKFSISQTGKTDIIFGKYSIKWIEEAVEFSKLLSEKKIPHGILTGPINKKSASLSGFKFAGHTDFLAHLYGVKNYSMMFLSKKMNTILVTIHMSLKNALKKINKNLILEKIIHAHMILKKLGAKNPLILISGLNPHAGENGLFGNEEKKFIVPAIKEAKKRNIKASGPYPPDTVFLKAYKNKNSCVVAMYHDQALIPYKLLSFDTEVNATIGLPVFRTSPDHGTADDIAWKGKASNKSFISAYKLLNKII